VQGQGIGFAIPINVAREILEQLRTRGHVSRGYLGIQLKEVDPDLQKLVHLKDARGALVEDVQEGSAGEKAGLKRYDVITAVSGKPVEDGDQLVRVIAARPPGSDVVLSVFRDGRTIQVTAHLAEPWIMGFDLYPMDTLASKKAFYKDALEKDMLVFFEHDPAVAAGHIREEQGKRRIVPAQSRS